MIAKVLFSKFSLFAHCFQLSLRLHMQMSLGSQDMGAADINRAYVSIKLWLLLVHMFESVQAGMVEGGMVNEDSAKMIWNELWPSFETIVLYLENDALNGSVSVKHAPLLEQLIHSHYSAASCDSHLVLSCRAVCLPETGSCICRTGNLVTGCFAE